MAASLYWGDREAMILENYEESTCLEMFDENVVYENSPSQFNHMLINTEVKENHDFDSHPFSAETRVSIHPDLVDIDISLPADKSLSVLCKENNSSGLPKINCDTLITNVNSVSQMCTDSFEVTASPCVNVPQQVKFSAREQCLSRHTIDVPVCNDLVDLSYEELKWLNITDQLYFRDAVLVFKSLHHLTPYYLSEKFKRNSEMHSRVTRNVNDLHLPLCRLVTGQRTFGFRGAKMWNSLPPEIKSEQSLKSFKHKLHSHLLAF